MSEPYIFTCTGRKIFPARITQDDVHFDDFAGPLSRLCRYGGHSLVHYSVAQHSVLLSLNVPDYLAQVALLHDIAEAYVTDLPRPIKRLCPDFKKIENLVTEVALAKYGVTMKEMNEFAFYDTRIIIDEMRVLMPRVDEEIERDFEPLGIHIEPWSAELAYKVFQARFVELFGTEALYA